MNKYMIFKIARGDCAGYQRLCLPESPDFIRDLPDYYALFTYSMFYGVGECFRCGLPLPDASDS